MFLDLTTLLANIKNGPLTTLDLSGTHIQAPHNTTHTEMGEFGPMPRSAEDEILWDILLNYQGKYQKTWKLPFSEDVTEVTINNVMPSNKNTLLVYGKCKRAHPGGFIMVFDRLGRSLFDWYLAAGQVITSVHVLANGDFAILADEILHIVSYEGKTKAQLTGKSGKIVGVYPLSENRLALLNRPQGQSTLETVEFFDSQYQYCKTFSATNYFVKENASDVIGNGQLMLSIVGGDHLIVHEHSYKHSEIHRCEIKQYVDRYHLINNQGVLKNSQMFQSSSSYDGSCANNSGSTSRGVVEANVNGIIVREVSRSGSPFGLPPRVSTKLIIYSWAGSKQFELADYECIRLLNEYSTKGTEVSDYIDASFTPYPETREYRGIYIKRGAIDRRPKNSATSNGDSYTWANDEITLSNANPSNIPAIQAAHLDRLWQALMTNETITECYFQGLPLKDDDAFGIAEVLRVNSTIKLIDLTGTGITNVGAQHLLSALKTNSSVKLLLKGNPITIDIDSGEKNNVSNDIGQLPNAFIIPYDQIKLIELIGEGTYGKVFKATYGDKTVAVKQLNMNTQDQKMITQFQNETTQMQSLSSEYTLLLIGVCLKPYYCLVTEYMAKGSLHDYLEKTQPTALQWLDRFNLALQIAKGIFYLHEKKVIHRDIKSLNILLDENGNAKLGDFGLSFTKDKSASGKTKSVCGTTAWMAPELLDPNIDNYEYNTETDIYAFAMVLYELATHQIPFQGLKDGQIIIKILSAMRPKIPENIPQAYSELMVLCWDHNPGSRPKMDAAINKLSNLKIIEASKKQTPQNNASGYMSLK